MNNDRNQYPKLATNVEFEVIEREPRFVSPYVYGDISAAIAPFTPDHLKHLVYIPINDDDVSDRSTNTHYCRNDAETLVLTYPSIIGPLAKGPRSHIYQVSIDLNVALEELPGCYISDMLLYEFNRNDNNILILPDGHTAKMSHGELESNTLTFILHSETELSSISLNVQLYLLQYPHRTAKDGSGCPELSFVTVSNQDNDRMLKGKQAYTVLPSVCPMSLLDTMPSVFRGFVKHMVKLACYHTVKPNKDQLLKCTDGDTVVEENHDKALLFVNASGDIFAVPVTLDQENFRPYIYIYEDKHFKRMFGITEVSTLPGVDYEGAIIKEIHNLDIDQEFRLGYVTTISVRKEDADKTE